MAVAPNLDKLNAPQKVEALELLNNYAARTHWKTDRINNVYHQTEDRNESNQSWIAVNWQIVWESLIDVDQKLNLFTLTKLLHICQAALPLHNPIQMSVRQLVRKNVEKSHLIKILQRVSHPFDLPDKQLLMNAEPEGDYVNFQLKRFTNDQLLSLSSNIVALLCEKPPVSTLTPSLENLLNVILRKLDRLLLEGLYKMNATIYFDFFKLALLLDV